MTSSQAEVTVQSIEPSRIKNNFDDVQVDFHRFTQQNKHSSAFYFQRNEQLKEIFNKNTTSPHSNSSEVTPAEIQMGSQNFESPDALQQLQTKKTKEKSPFKVKNQEGWHQKLNKMIFISRMIDSFTKFGIKYDPKIVEDPHFLNKLDSIFGFYQVYFPKWTFKNIEYKMCKYDPNYVKKESPPAINTILPINNPPAITNPPSINTPLTINTTPTINTPLPINNPLAENPMSKEPLDTTPALKFYEYDFLNLTILFKEYIYYEMINKSYNEVWIMGKNAIMSFQKKSQEDLQKFETIKLIIEAITISQASIYESSLLLADVLKVFSTSEDQEVANLIFCKAIIDRALSPDLQTDENTNRNLFWLLNVVHLNRLESKNLLFYLNFFIMNEIPILAGFKIPVKKPENMKEADYDVLQGFGLKENGGLISLPEYVHRKKILSRMYFMINYYKSEGILTLPTNYIIEPKSDSKTLQKICERFFNNSCELKGLAQYFNLYIQELIKTEEPHYLWEECLNANYHGLGMFVNTVAFSEDVKIYASKILNQVYSRFEIFYKENPRFAGFVEKYKGYREKWKDVMNNGVDKSYLHYLEL